MTLLPRDRRGLGEIVAFSSVTVAVGFVTVVYLLRGLEPPHDLVVALIGLSMLVLARGTQSAAERSGTSEFRNLESSELKQAREHMTEETKRLEVMVTRILDAQIERYLPPFPKDRP
jgi:hypothetical protein